MHLLRCMQHCAYWHVRGAGNMPDTHLHSYPGVIYQPASRRSITACVVLWSAMEAPGSVLVEPHAGWRHVAVTEHRTKRDYAEVLRELVEERYPDAECICVVQDNFNTHT